MKSVLLISSDNIIGGMLRADVNIAYELTNSQHAVKVILPLDNDYQKAKEWCEDNGVLVEQGPASLRLNPLALKRDWLNIKDIVEISRYIRRKHFDIVHISFGTNYISLKHVLAARLAGCRCVITMHSAHPWYIDSKRIRTLVCHTAAKLCNKIVTVSQWSRGNLISAGFPGDNITVVPLGLRPPKIELSRKEARELYGLPADAFVVAVASRFVSEKRVEDALAAVAKVAGKEANVHLAIAGDGELKEALHLQAAALLKDKVTFLGLLRDVNPLYAAADVFLLPSLVESFGLVYIEAAFHSIPSIGVSNGGAAEAIADQETGILVPPRDVNAIAEALIFLITKPSERNRMGAAARARALKFFTASRMAQEYKSIFDL